MEVNQKSLTGVVTELCELVLKFGRVDRATMHPDGVPESDTDHTVMLGVISCALAAKFSHQLDLGKIAQFALVHDLVEIYAGDVNTFVSSGRSTRQEKLEREHAALELLASKFGGTLPWLPTTISQYESQSTAEAKFVWAIDKLLPAVVNVVNEGIAIRACLGGSPSSQDVQNQYDSIRTRLELVSRDWPEILEIWDDSLTSVLPHFESQPA